MAPGNSTHCAEYPPSGSSLSITVNFLPLISTINPRHYKKLHSSDINFDIQLGIAYVSLFVMGLFLFCEEKREFAGDVFTWVRVQPRPRLFSKFNKPKQRTHNWSSIDRKLASIIALLIVLIGTAPATISAEIFVGVKQGDWIEYQVTFTGTPDLGHDVTWARMEIVDVQGKDISLAITTKFYNGTLLNETITLNLETGQLGDDFIIPANLKSGDTFFDKRQGNITISGVEERTYAGATRTIVSGATSQTTYYWDKATGVLVEGNSSFTDFTMNTKVDKTNMWQAQVFGLESTVFYALVIAAVAILVVIVFFVIRRKK